jgi:hypothetical protein
VRGRERVSEVGGAGQRNSEWCKVEMRQVGTGNSKRHKAEMQRVGEGIQASGIRWKGGKQARGKQRGGTRANFKVALQRWCKLKCEVCSAAEKYEKGERGHKNREFYVNGVTLTEDLPSLRLGRGTIQDASE